MDSTLLKGLAVLERLSQSDQALGVSALANDFELPKSNVHRTLNTLVEAGYVTNLGGGNYSATLKTWEMGVPILARHPIRRAAMALMHDLYKEANETINLIVLDGEDSLYIHQLSSSLPIRPTNTMGERAPAIMTVSGRAMLAFVEDAPKRLRELYGKQKNPKPPQKLNDLLQEADNIREQGYARAASVWRPGINSLASVIFGAGNRPVAAIAIAGPKERFNEEKIQNVVPLLLNTCTNIGQSIGN